MEEKNKQAAEAQEWLLPEQIEIIETSDPKDMLDKWLAEAVKRTWTETFRDEETGELMDIERTEFIEAKGVKCTQDVIQNIMFHMQAGEIKSVKVVTPHVGVWIETCKHAPNSVLYSVTPHVGAWIETIII